MIRELFVIVLFWTGFESNAEEAIVQVEPAEVEATCDGVLTQGGLVICRAPAGSPVTVAGVTLKARADGTAQFGLTRSAPSVIGWKQGDSSGDIDIKKRMDETTVLKGISCDKLDARTPEQKAHAGRSWEKKVAAWGEFREGQGATDGFLRPAEGVVSSPFGFTRRYVTEGCAEKVKPHFGYDIAAPTGAPIIAPAAGTVILADPDLYYEGGTVFLDHGHGLVSLFLHMSEVEVNVGDVLEAGDSVGKVGATGRVTGPHLHWAVKWRNPDTKDRGGDYYIDPALLLELPKS